ncbi:hypothetical protein BCR32DRAFT_292305 [Anaeromyces robustus]|jgi:hypothetical protein|uniref:Phosphoglycerate mutase-like protein n=1 Tax=Anaeromyces robustus TaxID=1754192 RepID=A0A1Y1XAY0_9FUNG|nr:hypothetical protein BCR32DRAFT_292305 [Anaeromyces robustus]|eukprot:ORX82912.1 hypothetical protein BCR32DRAFT_292305 [Anaeromyces robustus]
MASKILLFVALCLLYLNATEALLKDKVTIQGKVMLIRHAEKPPSGNDLSTMGWRRAQCIRDKFIANEGDFKDLTPKKIYAQKASKKDETIPDSRRQIETVAPLARQLDLTIDNRFTSFQLDELSEDIGKLSADQYPVLVSWNHDEIKNFLINFGMQYQIAPTYPSKRYDLVWIIEPDPSDSKKVKFSYFSQNCEGLGDYRFSSDANSQISRTWVMRSLIIATITLVLIIF